jgi:hypothetical protein
MTNDVRRSGSPDLADTIREVIEARLRDLHTALPGEVLAFDAATQTATVRPTVWAAVLGEDGRYVNEPLPEIYDVPVMFPRTAAGYITFPLVAGDTVLLVFCERPIGQWRYTGRDGSPGDQSAHGLGSAVAIPGLFANKDKLAASAFPGAGIMVAAGANETRLGAATASAYVALASLVATELGKIQTTLGTGSNSGGAVVFGTPYVPASVAATKVKAV